MLDLFGIRHLILPSSVLGEKSGLRRLDEPSAKGVAVYENPDALPFAFAVAAMKFVQSQRDAELAIRDPNVARGLYAVVDAAAGNVPASILNAPMRPGRLGQCRLAKPLTDRIELDCALDQPGFVVINESFHPQFEARLDRAETPIFRANAFVMATQVPAGKHHLELEYSEQSLVPGFAASLCGIAIALLLVLRNSGNGNGSSGS